MKCFNCNLIEHYAANCQRPRRELGACFKCFQVGHQAKDCTVAESTSRTQVKSEKKDINSVFDQNDSFVRKLQYCFVDTNTHNKWVYSLTTLFDTGSPVSFIKDEVVPSLLIEPPKDEDTQYGGLNSSRLQAKGRVSVEFSLDNEQNRVVSLIVVPSSTMKTTVVIGRDILQQVFKLGSAHREQENEVIREILNINIGDMN